MPDSVTRGQYELRATTTRVSRFRPGPSSKQSTNISSPETSLKGITTPNRPSNYTEQLSVQGLNFLGYNFPTGLLPYSRDVHKVK